MKAVYRALKSVPLAVALILLVALGCIAATLVPQNREPQFYLQAYPPAAARLILATGLDGWFRSAAFLVPAGVLFVNLLLCTASRLSRQLRPGGARRFGPDILHAGILLLLAAGVLTGAGRRDAMLTLAAGERASLPGGYELRLASFDFFKYPDGRPRDWVSTVDVLRAGRPAVSGYRIEVNRPLRLGRLRVYQASFGTEARATARDESGAQVVIRRGEAIRSPGGSAVLLGVSDGRARFAYFAGGNRMGTRELGPGEPVIGPYTLAGVDVRDVTGLRVVRDPGFVPALAAFVLIALGVTFTGVQQARRRED